MVLIIDDQEVSSFQVEDLFDLFPILKRKSVNLVQECLRQVTGEENCLYVGQREMAVLRPEDGVELVGSEDATTCHILVLREPTTSTTGLAHLDTEDPAQLQALEREVRRRCVEMDTVQYDVTIIGGYLDERDTSVQMTASLFEEMSSSTAVFRLVAAAIGEVNTSLREGVAWPRLYGGAVSVSTGQVFSATFSQHGPDPDIRSLLTQGVETLHNIYEPGSGEIVLQYHHYHILRNPQFLLSKSDTFILRNLSTSPLVEPADFCDKIRETFRRMISDPRPRETLFPSGQSRRYRREGLTGRWTLIQ